MDQGQIIVSIIGLITIVGLTSLLIDFWIYAPESNIETCTNTALLSKKSILEEEYNNDLEDESFDTNVLLNEYESVIILDD